MTSPEISSSLLAAPSSGFLETPSLADIARIRGRRLLIDGRIGAAEMTISGVHITAIDLNDSQDASPADKHAMPGAGQILDAGNFLVLPGIVDLHGDAFERSVMPRPGVSFSYDQALHDVDRQLLGNGITTEFHGVTVSWEMGLRGVPYAQKMLDALARNDKLLGAKHHVHLRFETHNVADVRQACAWIAAGKVHFVAMNDHLPTMAKRLGDDRKLLQYAARAECDLDVFSARIRGALAVADQVPLAIRTLVEAAQAAGLRVASHDDESAAVRRAYDEMGCKVAEFPLTRDAAEAARGLGNAIVFGAPNVVRGRSHTAAPNATEMIREGLCDILTSDYYYPAPLAAALHLHQSGVLPLADAWRLVSTNPARAAGLEDRGALAVGLRADAIIVDDRVPGVPRVCAVVVGGTLRYADAYGAAGLTGRAPQTANPTSAISGSAPSTHATHSLTAA